MTHRMSILRRLLPGVIASAGATLLLLSGSPAATATGPSSSEATHIADGLQRQMRADPGRPLPVIVQLKAASASVRQAGGDDGTEALALVSRHGRGDKALGMIRGASGALTAAEIDATAHDPRVAAIYEDVSVRATDGTLVTAYPAEVNAPGLWDAGRSGRGVTVAVLDSGIAQDADLTQPASRILTAVNFADPLPIGQQDPGGHGTHVAGVIAGNGLKSNGAYVGIAPNANLVDVRVLDSQGSGRASSVIAGLQWVVAHKNMYGIRVVNLSFGAPATTDFIHDPIAAAAEVAWLRGMVVVSAAGNGGPGKIDSPGIDPHIITVGAVDDQGTPWVGDDTVPIWSGWGTPLGSDAKPDIVAPGRRIVSLRVPGSTLDQQLPGRVVAAANGSSYFRLSGTSMSTGVVSGAIALLLEAHPALTPNQVKALLTSTGRAFGSQGGPAVAVPSAANGIANPIAAVGATTPLVAPRGLRLANAAAQALYPIVRGQPLVWKNATYAAVDWTKVNWTNLVWDNLVWDNLVWDSFAWDNLVWDNLVWDNLVWDAATWNNLLGDSGAPPAALD